MAVKAGATQLNLRDFLTLSSSARIFEAMRRVLEDGLLHQHPEVRLQGRNNRISSYLISSLSIGLHSEDNTLHDMRRMIWVNEYAMVGHDMACHDIDDMIISNIVRHD